MITPPRIDVRLPPSGLPSDVHIQVQSSANVQQVLVGMPVKQAFKNLGLLYTLCKCAHAVAFTSAVECARGIPTSAETLSARAKLVQAEALQELTWKLMFDLPQLIGLKPKLEWLQYVKQKVKQPTATLWQAAFGKGSDTAHVELLENGQNRLADFVLQGGYLNDMTNRIQQHDWTLTSEYKTESVLMPVWEQLKKHFVSLVLNDQSSPIGHIWSEPTRQGPACSVSEVYCARGVLSYALCVDSVNQTLTSLNILPPTVQRFTYGSAIQSRLAAMPKGSDESRVQQARLYLSLLNPCYAFEIALEQPDPELERGHQHA